MTFKTRLSVLLVSTPVLAFVLVGGLIGKEQAQDQKYRHFRVFEDVVNLVINNYVEEVELDRAMEGAMRGLADGLDPDSAYLNARQVKALEAGSKPPEGDVGLELTRQYYLRVISARDNSPAATAGLQTGDYVRAIDGRATRDMSVFEGSRLLRGDPGSTVTLTVIRGNAADPHEITLEREKPQDAAVSSRLAGPGVGYLRIATFRGDPSALTADLRRQVTALQKNGARSLVIDIRRTAEGPMENGLAAARLFVDSGTLVIKAGRDEETSREVVSAQQGDGAIDLPVTLLVTNGTAGPAELFAAALAGNERADLVGERTIGRAGVQKLVRLPENRGLWLTYAKFLTPEGEPIHGRGIQPDVQVEEPDVEFGAAAPETDPILDAALARIASKKAA